jgi:hypothetical protein
VIAIRVISEARRATTGTRVYQVLGLFGLFGLLGLFCLLGFLGLSRLLGQSEFAMINGAVVIIKVIRVIIAAT